jgi:Na+-transporting methylmalonyl-CoA/oxaloacetate decarboxylase gamma subunit
MTFWEIFLLGLMALGVAFVLTFLGFGILIVIDFLQGKKLKKNIPTDNEELSKPSRPTQEDIKEVEEDERRKFGKFREFEKLRRYADSPVERTIKSPTGTRESEEQFILSSDKNKPNETTDSGVELYDPNS